MTSEIMVEVDDNGFPTAFKAEKGAKPTKEEWELICAAYEKAPGYMNSWLDKNAPKEIKELVNSYIELIELADDGDSSLTQKGVACRVEAARNILSIVTEPA